MQPAGYLFGRASVSETIRRRKSVRTYSRTPLPPDVLDRLREQCLRSDGPFDAPVRIELLHKPGAAGKARLGTYGVILGASWFIAAAAERSERAMEQVGYLLERIVLSATSMGLGTCWLAATFTRGGFAEALRLRAGEIIPAVSPVGYPAAIRGPADLLIKPVPGMRPRAPWRKLFFDRSLGPPLDAADAGPYALPLEMVRLAPSAANRQPWRVVREGGRFHFYLAHDAIYRRRHDFDVQKIDMGIAMLHFESAVREAGLAGSWEPSPAHPPAAPEGVEHIATWATG